MGQILQLDKLGLISHSAGVISLGASRVTIGGQQFKTLVTINRTIATDLTMTANGLYMVYAVVVAGNVELRISANVNSVGPSGGFTRWGLVGAFYATGDAVPVFGSFVNIDGVPHTKNVFSSGVMRITTDAGVWNKGAITKDVTTLERDGAAAILRISFSMGAGGSQANGNNLWQPPTNIVFDQSQYDPSGTAYANAIGSGYVTSSATGKNGDFFGSSSAGGSFGFMFDQPSGSNNLSSFGSQPNSPLFNCGGTIRFPVSGWSNIALKDL